MVLAARTFTVRKQFLEDLKEHCSAERIGALRKALLIFHAPLDAIVGIDNAGEIGRGRHPACRWPPRARCRAALPACPPGPSGRSWRRASSMTSQPILQLSSALARRDAGSALGWPNHEVTRLPSPLAE